jgi:DNA (cytosine-5)-methyltransferase 1
MGGLLFNGSGRPLDLDAPARTLPASMGGNATPIVDQLELGAGESPWVVDYHRRLLGGRPPLKRAPQRLRRLTVEEAAALQSFPSGFRFFGTPASQYRQIGNAVPPRLARALARSLLRQLHAVPEVPESAA